MKVPFFVLSRGDFNNNKRLFSYNLNEIHTFPIFTIAENAQQFADEINSIDDKMALAIQVCDNQKHAYQLFATLMSYIKDLKQVIINPPSIIKNDQQTDEKTLRIINNVCSIDEFVNTLYQLKIESASKTLKSESPS